MESLVHDKASLIDEEHAPKVELKPLPSSSRYEFLDPNSTYPMIVNVSLNASQVDYFLKIIRLHHKAMGCTLNDLKEIHPFVCIHHILMKDDSKPSIAHQKRLNPKMHDVVKKEILKLHKVDNYLPNL